MRVWVVVLVAVAGCGGKGNLSADAGIGSRVDASPSDASVSVVDSGPTADAAERVVANIALTGQPVAAAIDPSGNRLYVGVADPLSAANLGVAVIDTSNDALTTTVAPPKPSSGTLFPFNVLALDPNTHTLFAAPLFSSTIYPFDTTQNTFGTSFDVTGAAVTEGCLGIIDLTIDPASARLYVSCQGSAGDAEIVVFDTTNDSALQSIVLTDLGSPFGHLALDTTDHLLFVSNAQQLASPVLVDTIDTTNNTEVGSQQALPAASLVGQQGGTDGALVTSARSDAGVSGTFYSLQTPSSPDVDLPNDFVPTSFTRDYLGGYRIFGYDGQTGAPEFLIVTLPASSGGSLTVGSPQPLTGEIGNYEKITGAWADSVSDVFITWIDSPPDGGTAPHKSIYHLRFF